MKTIVLIALLFLAGCSWMSPFSGNTQRTEQNYSKSQSDESYQAPAFVEGHTVILNNRIRKSEINKVHKEHPLNAWQRFCRWLGNLSILTILVVGGGLAAGTTAPAVFLVKRFWAFKKGLLTVVKTIDEHKVIEKDPELKTALSKAMDSDTKKLIDDLKRAG